MSGFGSKDRVEILNPLYRTGLEKFMTKAVQTNGGTFQRNSTLRTKVMLVQVTGWINRFLANITRPQSDRESGELNPRELKQAEEQIIKTAQQECFPDEI